MCEPAPAPVHWLAWQPTPYNDLLFKRLTEEPSLHLTVHFRSRGVPSHPWKTDLAKGYHARVYDLRFGVDWQLLAIAFKSKNAFFFVGGWDHPTSIALLTTLRLMNRAYGLWTDTPNLDRQRSPAYAWVRSRYLRWIFSGAVRVMGTGAPGVAALRRMGVAAERLGSLPFFADLDAYSDSDVARRKSSKRLRILSAGRVANRLKGHDIAVRALAVVAARLGAQSFEYCIAGTGPDEDMLKRLALETGLCESVKLLGWVEPEEIANLFRQADILIHPSPAHDPFPNAILEAMAAGVVVLASDVCGSALDRIEHGVNGFLHAAGDAPELSRQIAFLAEHPEQAAEMGRRARATATQWPVERGIAIIRDLVREALPMARIN